MLIYLTKFIIKKLMDFIRTLNALNTFGEKEYMNDYMIMIHL